MAWPGRRDRRAGRGLVIGFKGVKMVTMIEAALWWMARGVLLVPCQPGGKRQVTGFGARQGQVTDEVGAWFWFGERRCNLGLVCGGPAGLVCLDFDDLASYERWRVQIGALAETLTESTRRPGGRHVFFFAGAVSSGRVGGYEVKGSGSVVVASPSVVGGVTYQVVNPGAGVLSVAASALDLPPFSESKRQVALNGEGWGDDVVSRIKRAYDLVAEIERAGVELAGRGAVLRGRCPFHDDREASFWVVPGRGVWGCFVCFPEYRGLDVINFVAQRDGLTIGETIKRLAVGLDLAG